MRATLLTAARARLLLHALMLALAVLAPPAAAQVPPAAWAWRAELAESAYERFGPGAPVATLAAQVHQESAWRPNAVSHAGAQGLTQFMPGTARDMAERFGRDCAPANPFDPVWALRCRDHYLHSLMRALRPMGSGLDECARWTFALRAYNGGAGWVQRDRRAAQQAQADPDSPDEVARFNAGRSVANFRENVEYAPRIYRLQPRYVGWGRAVCREANR